MNRLTEFAAQRKGALFTSVALSAVPFTAGFGYNKLASSHIKPYDGSCLFGLVWNIGGTICVLCSESLTLRYIIMPLAMNPIAFYAGYKFADCV
jgi:hypothetical protein